MILRGECLCCTRIAACPETDARKVLSSYTCALFEGVPEPVYMARLTMMQQFGDANAVDAMLNRKMDQGEEET